MSDDELTRWRRGASMRTLVPLDPSLDDQLGLLARLDDVPSGLLLDRAVRLYIKMRMSNSDLEQKVRAFLGEWS